MNGISNLPKFMRQMGFPDAMEAVIQGESIVRLAWQEKEPDSYCALRDGHLSIFRHGKWHRWIVNDGDMLATDWMILQMVGAHD